MPVDGVNDCKLYLMTGENGYTELVIPYNLEDTFYTENLPPDIVGSETATFTVCIDKRTLLSILYGRKVTNNWLKLHGGIMVRKSHIRRCK